MRMNSSNADAFGSVASGTFLTVLMIAGIVLAVLTVLMPVVVYCIYSEMQKLRKIAEKSQWMMDRMRQDVAKVRERWEA